MRLASHLPAHKWKIILAVFCMLGAGASSSLIATLLGKLTDAGFYNQEAWVVLAAPIGLILVSLLHGGCMFGSNYLLGCVSQAILVKLRGEMFHRMLHWPMETYQTNSTGLVTSKFVFEANFALSNAAKASITLVRDSIQVVSLTIVLFWHNWHLTLVAFIVAPALALILRAISRRMRRIVKNSQEALASMISRVQESYSAAQIVKVSNTYDFEDERFSLVNNRIRSLAMKTIQTQSLSTPLTQMVTMVAIAFVVGAALFEASQGLLTFGEFITFLAAMLLLRTPIQALSGLNGTFAAIGTASKSIFTMLNAAPEEDKGTAELKNVRGEIRFDHVSLRYPGADKDALHDINLTIKPGEHVAFVGQSGAGKSTIVNLVPRFLEPMEGRVLIDGVDVRDITLESLRNQIAMVSQDTVLLDASIRENITYGLTNKTDAQIWEALKAAALDEFVKGLSQGLDSRVGEAGGLLSGGQKQRLAIARAFLKDAAILIFDEATSALDAEAESKLAASFKEIAKGRTVLTVAHRLTTITGADKVAVFADGAVRELGTPAELLTQLRPFSLLLNQYKQGVSIHVDD